MLSLINIEIYKTKQNDANTKDLDPLDFLGYSIKINFLKS